MHAVRWWASGLRCPHVAGFDSDPPPWNGKFDSPLKLLGSSKAAHGEGLPPRTCL